MKEDSLLTLIGLKILKDYFLSKEVEWKFVAMKGRKYLKQNEGIEENVIDDLIKLISIPFI